jgi:hypothetical protein
LPLSMSSSMSPRYEGAHYEKRPQRDDSATTR